MPTAREVQWMRIGVALSASVMTPIVGWGDPWMMLCGVLWAVGAVVQYRTAIKERPR